MVTDSTMFDPIKNRYLAEMISLTSVSEAKASVRKLSREFRGAAQRPKQLRVARATMLAANRAKVISKNMRVARSKRLVFKAVWEIYAEAARKMFKAYRRGK